jgi:predicted ATPase
LGLPAWQRSGCELGDGSRGHRGQFIIATHSPILLGHPGAAVYAASEPGLERIDAEDADAVRLTRSFTAAPEQFMPHLLDENEVSH